MYFNKKYKRIGALYQDIYKTVLVTSEPQFIYLSKYIHKQALASQGPTLQGKPSSFGDFIGERKTEWVHPEEVLSYFSKSSPSLSYKSFVLENPTEDEEITLGGLKLED